MPASHRSALLALAAALALCACEAGASPQAERDPEPPRIGLSGPAPSPDSACKSANAGERCAPRPEVCPMIYHPVCGADGRTYPNVCHAERAGVGLAHSGACATGATPLSAPPARSGSPGPNNNG